MGELSVEEAIYTTRAMRRLRPDPVPEDDLRFVVEAATQAASAANSQTWAFVVVRDAKRRERIGELYRELAERNVRPGAEGELGLPEEQRKPWAHAYRFSKFIGQAPALIMVCMRDRAPQESSLASSYYGSIYPAVQNLMLAARSRGLGTVLTTLHLGNEAAFKDVLGLPESVQTVALIPIGYPTGEWKRPTRRGVNDVIHWDEWAPER